MLGTVVAARDTKVKQKRKITALWSLQTINMMNKVSHIRSWKVVSVLGKVRRAEGRVSAVLWGSFYSLFKWLALQGRPTEEVAIEQRLEEIEGVWVPGRGDVPERVFLDCLGSCNCQGPLPFWIQAYLTQCTLPTLPDFPVLHPGNGHNFTPVPMEVNT